MEDLKVYRGTVYGENAVIVKLPRPVELKGATNESTMVEPIWVLGRLKTTDKNPSGPQSGWASLKPLFVSNNSYVYSCCSQ